LVKVCELAPVSGVPPVPAFHVADVLS